MDDLKKTNERLRHKVEALMSQLQKDEAAAGRRDGAAGRGRRERRRGQRRARRIQGGLHAWVDKMTPRRGHQPLPGSWLCSAWASWKHEAIDFTVLIGIGGIGSVAPMLTRCSISKLFMFDDTVEIANRSPVLPTASAGLAKPWLPSRHSRRSI